MTPKEKAEELMAKFMAIKSTKLSDFSVIYSPVAKLCALIAVDELSKFLIDAESEDFNLPDEFSIQYWQEVKQEIEKL
jgi:hypothetical protein